MHQSRRSRRSSGPLVDQAHQVAMNMLRPISRKYDLAEHEYPKELDMLAAMIDGLAESGASEGAGAAGVRRGEPRTTTARCKNGTNLASVHVDQGDVLGRRRPAAVDAAPGARQLRDRLGRRRRAARAVRRRLGRHGDHRARHRLRLRQHQDHGASSTATSTSSTARRSSSPPATAPTASWSGRRSTRSSGRAAIKSFVVAKGTPGHAGRAARAQARHPRLRHRDDHLRGLPGARRRTCSARPRSTTKQGFAGAMATFDNTRPLVAAMAIGCAARFARPDPRAARGGRRRGRLRPAGVRPVGGGREVPPDGGRLGGRPAADAAGGVDGRQPQAQLARGLDGQGQGRPGRLRRHAVAASSCAARSATARASCWRSGHATPRSSTSSRAPSRSSS